MPNTKSAERRMRSSVRKRERNFAVKSRLKTLEKRYLSELKGGEIATASDSLKQVTSALDKAAKVGVVHPSKADRKKSRLTVRLNRQQAAAQTAQTSSAPA